MLDKATWKEQMGLAADTTQVTFYPKERHKQEWKEAARHAGYSSLSSYLYDLVLEGRAYRQEDSSPIRTARTESNSWTPR